MYTDEELAGLSEVEREALLEGEEEQEETIPEENEETEEAAETPEEPAEEVEEAEEAEEAEGTEEESPEELPEENEARTESVRLPEELSAEFKARFDELDAKLDEGELTLTEYNRERDALNRQVFNHEIDQREDAQWQREQEAFFKVNKDYLEDKFQYSLLDAAVKHIAASRPELSGGQVLREAHKSLQARLTPKAEQLEEKPAKTPKSPKPQTPNLGDMPPAANSETDSEFTHLDKLAGLGLEAALEKLTPAQYERYLAR